MDRNEVSEKLSGVLVSELGLDGDKINDDAHFEEDLDVDSLGVVELLMALEDEFGVQNSDAEAHSIKTVGKAVARVHGQADSCKHLHQSVESPREPALSGDGVVRLRSLGQGDLRLSPVPPAILPGSGRPEREPASSRP